MASRRIIRLAAMLLLLVITAASLAGVASPAPVSGGLLGLPNKFTSYVTRARTAKFLDKIDGFFERHGDNLVEKFLPPPAPPQVDVGRLYSSIAAARSAGLYTVDLSVGTPAQAVSGVVVDISTQLVWVRCRPLICGSTAAGCPPSSTFRPGDSGNFSFFTCSHKVCQAALGDHSCDAADGKGGPACRYVATYGGASNTTGYLAADAFSFGAAGDQRVVFGCGGQSAGDYADAPGVVGLGRGPLSLVSQLGVSSFSYLLAPADSAGGGGDGDDTEIQLGDAAVVRTTAGRARSTRLLKSSRHGDLYYVALTGVKVDGQDLAIPAGTFELRSDGSGGAFLSTTVPVTYLVDDAYAVVRRAFAAGMMNSTSSKPKPLVMDTPDLKLDLCYAAESVAGARVPTLTMVFDGVDAEMDLRPENYFVRFKHGAAEVACLAVLPSRDVSLLGSLLQRGTRMVYDLHAEQLTFVATTTTTTTTEEHPSTAPPSRAKAKAPPHSQPSASLIALVLVPLTVWMLLF